MNIRYSNGFQIEGFLLTRTEDSMRVAIRHSDDILQLSRIHDTWVSEDCEPVQVDFAWAKQNNGPVVTLDDCICSKELAAELLHLLFSADQAAPAESPALGSADTRPIYQQLI